MGVQPKHKHFTKTLLFFDCKSNTRHKDKDCMTDVTFTRSIPVLHAEKSVGLPIVSRVACIPRKVIRNVTSDSDVPEIEMDMRMSYRSSAQR